MPGKALHCHTGQETVAEVDKSRLAAEQELKQNMQREHKDDSLNYCRSRDCCIPAA